MSERSEIARTERLMRQLGELDLTAMLIDSLVDVRYLTGFTGSAGLALVFSDPAASGLGGHTFFTDSRYTTQAAEQVPDSYERVIVSGEALEALTEHLAAGGGKLGFDEAATTVKAHRRIRELLGDSWELVGGTGTVAGLRAVKEPVEVELLRAASQLADAALEELLEAGLVGRTESEVALDLETRMRSLGAEGSSFPPIVAAGAHGALPHAEPRAVPIPSDVLVTIDWGAVHEGYCSDCTRTYATGDGISDLDREIYALVLDAQEQGVAGVTAGVNGREVDAISRSAIEAGGHGEHFGHGLGHGVGMEVHEAPRLSRLAPEDPLVVGNVVTVEPGVYLPGLLGVRIEDLLVVGDGTPDVLTSLPKELTIIS